MILDRYISSVSDQIRNEISEHLVEPERSGILPPQPPTPSLPMAGSGEQSRTPAGSPVSQSRLREEGAKIRGEVVASQRSGASLINNEKTERQSDTAVAGTLSRDAAREARTIARSRGLTRTP